MDNSHYQSIHNDYYSKKNLIDCHIHIEKGEYKKEWFDQFVKTAIEREIDEIWLLEHCYRFKEFIGMYDSVCNYSNYISNWFHSKAGVYPLADYLRLIDHIRSENYPIKIHFGLEVCYFKQQEDFIRKQTLGKGLDFLVGSVHFIDDFAFDHKAEHWANIDVDHMYHRYFETCIDLAKSGVYTGIAHPDAIKLFGHTASFDLNEYYNSLAAELAKNHMYAEQNSGIKRRTNAELGMNIDLIKTLRKHGVKIQTASDAHRPEDVGLYIKEMYEKLQMDS